MKKSNVFASRSFRKGTLSVIFTVILIVAVILLNVVATAVSNRYPFSVDLTANQDYTVTLSQEYETFVKDIDLPVTVTVCAAEDDFADSNYASAMVQILYLMDYYNGISDTTNRYARQVAAFMKTLPVKNNRITLAFANPNSVTDFSAVSTKYASEQLSYGDIILACTHTVDDGTQTERYQVVKMTDVFTTETNQDYYYNGYNYSNTITGSSLAGQIISALYIVTSESSVNVAVLGGHNSETEYTQSLTSFLRKNNYTFTDVDNLLTGEIPEDTVFAVIASPQTDYTAAEIRALEDFLRNDGNYGRTLVYLPASGQPVLPNLEEFLAEWGIRMLPAVSYEETEGAYLPEYYGGNNTLIFAQDAGSEYTEGYNGDEQFFYPMPYRLAKTEFETNGTYKTTRILTTQNTASGYPVGEEADENWTPANAAYKGPFDLAVLGTYQATESTAVIGESHVLMLSGDSFLHEQVLSSPACYNSTLVLNLFNGLSGQNDATTVSIEDKTISTSSFYEKLINTNAGTVVMIVFIGVIPLALVVISFLIWRARKKK